MKATDCLQEFTCPDCRSGELQIGTAIGDVQTAGKSEGIVACAACGARFPVIEGIPHFAPQANYAASFGFQWNEHPRTQLDSHTGLPVSQERLSGVTGWARSLRGEKILEAGSGAGRFTEILLQSGARVFSFDYSVAVVANRVNNGGHPNIVLFQADIYRIPLRPRSFDKVLCLGVLQHTPDPARAFVNLAAMVRPGGALVIDIYAKRLSALLQWKYILRPLTKRMNPRSLYRVISATVPPLLPLAAWLRRIAGRIGSRLLPIVEYSHLGLTRELNKEWAILDTFDMYSPAHDHPQSLATVRGWFERAGFADVEVRNGPNGVIGRGRHPDRVA